MPRAPPSTEAGSRAGSGAVEGTVERIVFQNPDNLWTVARLGVTGPGGKIDLVTLVGALPGVASGTSLRASGRYVQDPTYGEQFQVEGFVPLTPDTELGIERTLGSGMVKGIGPQLASRIVKRFGLQTLAVLEQTPWRLREVPGLGKAKAKSITEAWEAHRGTREVLILLQSHGVSPALAVRIQKTYGARTAEVLRQNPYRLAQDVHGIGFLSADRIAQAFGVAADAPARADAGLIHLLQEQASRGHVYAPRDRLCAEGERTLSIPAAKLGEAVERLAERGAVVREHLAGKGEICYPAPLHAAEVSAAQNLARLLRTPLQGETPLNLSEGAGGKARLPLTDEQRAALGLALANRMMVITGGPGVGKTTLVRALVELLDPGGEASKLAAPTGRAAKRLSEATGRPATTLHRLLEFTPQDGQFTRGAERPLETELVVVDEASMIDLPLFAGLLAALPDRCRLVLVGDADQLPPVGPGAVLAELLAVAQVPAARLTHIHRQAAESQIVQAAHQVNAGRVPAFISPADATGRDSDFHVIEREDPAEVVATIADLVADRIPKGLGIAASEVQVLSPRHRGDAGTQALNRALQARLNPDGAQLGGPPGGSGASLRVGDKVMQLRNDYEKEVFNGDVGRVAMASDQRLTVIFDGRPVTYEPRELDDLQLAYACSVHKAQGSEYPAVVLALLTQHHPMLQRNLVYTALTRGRRLVVIVGSRRALRAAVQHGERAVRYSLLAQRIRAAMGTNA